MPEKSQSPKSKRKTTKKKKDNMGTLEKVVEDIKKGLQMDGGDIDLISFKNGVVVLQFQGACVGCPLSMVTYSQFIEKRIRSLVPGVKEIQVVE